MFTRRFVLAGAAASLVAAPAVLRAQTLAPLRFTLDWARQGPNAYTDMGAEKGFFREAGIDVRIDRGFGSGRVPSDIAAGAYDMGQGDISPVIKFMAENPDSDLVVVGLWGDSSLMCVTVRSDSDVMVPKDLEGKTLAAPETDGGRQLFPAFASAEGVDMSTIEWMTVSSDLRETMLVQGRADGITGALTSTSMSLQALGMMPEQTRVMMYRDSLELLGYCYMSTRRFVSENPETVRGALQALYRSLSYANSNRAEAIEVLQRVEPLTDVVIETARQDVSFDQGMLTQNVIENGIGALDPARLQRAIETLEEAYGLPKTLQAEAIYDPSFLPDVSVRRV